MLPKAELHVHLEGTAPPWLIQKIAARNHVAVSSDLFKDEHHFAWNDFLHFLQVYEDASMVIRHPQDYYDITYEYLKACAAEGAIYVEMSHSPEHAEKASGIPNAAHQEAIEQAISDARDAFNIEGRIIIVSVRHYGLDSVMRVARQAVEEATPSVVGFNIAGDEGGYPPGQFAPAFELVHAAGLPCTAHAGEMVGAQGIWEAIDTLLLQRIGHGVRAIEDPQLIQAIIDRGIVLEVCPTSNIVLDVYQNFNQHPLGDLIRAGVKVTLNSDDPPYFGTTIGQEYAIAQEVFGLTDKELIQLTRNAIEASFADAATKASLLARL